MLEATALVRPVQRQIFPIPDTRHRLNTEEVGQREYGRVLSLCIGMEREWLNFTLVFKRAIKNVYGFLKRRMNEVAEQRDVTIGDVIIADAAVAINTLVHVANVPNQSSPPTCTESAEDPI